MLGKKLVSDYLKKKLYIYIQASPSSSYESVPDGNLNLEPISHKS